MSRQSCPVGVSGNVICLQTYREARQRQEAEATNEADAKKRYWLLARNASDNLWEIAALPVMPRHECREVIESVKVQGWQPLLRLPDGPDPMITFPWDSADPANSFLGFVHTLEQQSSPEYTNYAAAWREAYDKGRIAFVALSVGAA